ncbi:peptidase C39-like protein [Ochrobactrum sp. BH3]|nr:peptidase C39-like protein [Ochrobactrum sp. BH3]
MLIVLYGNEHSPGFINHNWLTFGFEMNIALTGSVGAGRYQGSLDTGLCALVAIAGHYRIVASPVQIARGMALPDRANANDLRRAAKSIGLKSRCVNVQDEKRLGDLPVPAVACVADGSFVLFVGENCRWQIHQSRWQCPES